MNQEDDKACRKCRTQFGNHFNFVALIVGMILLLRWVGISIFRSVSRA